MMTIVAVLGGAALWLLPSAVLYWLFRHQRLPHCQCGEQAVHPGSQGAYDPESGMLHELSRCYPEREHIGPINYYDDEE